MCPAVARLLNKRGKIGMVEIPYRSTPHMLQDTAAGTTQLMSSSVVVVDAPPRYDRPAE